MRQDLRTPQSFASNVVSLNLADPTNDHLSALINDIATNRNREAFARLFEHYAPRLKSFTLKQGTSPSRAEELVQETMIMVWRKAASFDASKGTPSNWIYTILRNKRIDMFRKERHPEYDLEEGLEVADTAPGAEDRVEAGQQSEILRAAIDDLPEAQREIILKSFYEDMSHGEIAEDLGLPLGTVKSRIRLGVTRLKQSLGGHQ
ncbi:MAG: sigma-70 family RNA polymerase sigma factor [Alphaproteobacteria bacterium]|nr:MAG: sigma-70 family RNA polymerase sigma factor [Alphaproteobacteria bacterium]